jgi:hypothetical protein
VGTSHKAPGVRWKTGYLATDQSDAIMEDWFTWLPSSADATMEELAERRVYLVCFEVRDWRTQPEIV